MAVREARRSDDFLYNSSPAIVCSSRRPQIRCGMLHVSTRTEVSTRRHLNSLFTDGFDWNHIVDIVVLIGPETENEHLLQLRSGPVTILLRQNTVKISSKFKA
ncbi:hypothetical protein AB6A40_003059 [Gnathostoma spinigerum]|uniref:Uncharacterized protein n=1 Tax=Gnathostoma spinigerum TaxID=75299 RepID=A0ABD6EJ87_9BILA